MGQINLKNIIAFIQGNFRYKFYYTDFKFLIPLHIREQIDLRIECMNQECFENGSCKECGCRTTHLQMANKKCDGDCYPHMVGRSKWKYLKDGNITNVEGELWMIKHGMFKKLSK